MNRYIRVAGVFITAILFVVFFTPIKEAKAQPNVSVSFNMFYDNLSPYGDWVDYQGNGYAWIPRGVGRDFRPYYTNGNWAMTDYGNTWVSNYDWGWAAFHYGRWTYDNNYGWMWLPDTQWGPAWVTWRNGGGYCGWAPMSPGLSINMCVGPNYRVSNNWWVFIPNRYIHTRGFQRYYRGPRYNNYIINNTTIINNTYRSRYVYGPRRATIQRATGRRVNAYTLRGGNRMGKSRINNRTLNMYRPNVRQRQATTRPRTVAKGRNGNRGQQGVRQGQRRTQTQGGVRQGQRKTAQTTQGVRQGQRRTQTQGGVRQGQRKTGQTTQGARQGQRRTAQTTQGTRHGQRRAQTTQQPNRQKQQRANVPNRNNRQPVAKAQQNRQQRNITQQRQKSWQQQQTANRQRKASQNRTRQTQPARTQQQSNRNTQRTRQAQPAKAQKSYSSNRTRQTQPARAQRSSRAATSKASAPARQSSQRNYDGGRGRRR